MPVMYEPYYVGLGYKTCAQITAGMSTSDAVSQLGIEGQIWCPQSSLSPSATCARRRSVLPARPKPRCLDDRKPVQRTIIEFYYSIERRFSRGRHISFVLKRVQRLDPLPQPRITF